MDISVFLASIRGEVPCLQIKHVTTYNHMANDVISCSHLLSQTSMSINPLPEAAAQELLDAFRSHYRRFESSIQEAVSNSADSVVLWRLGDDLVQYTSLVNEVRSQPVLNHRVWA